MRCKKCVHLDFCKEMYRSWFHPENSCRFTPSKFKENENLPVPIAIDYDAMYPDVGDYND